MRANDQNFYDHRYCGKRDAPAPTSQSYALSSSDAFSRSSVTSAAAFFSWVSSADADMLPLTDWLAVAGFFDES